MCVLWRYRLALQVLAFLSFLLSSEAQILHQAPAEKMLYARGNHWAVGHLMGKKSVDEDTPGPAGRGGAPGGADADTQTSMLLRALLTQLTGLPAERRSPRVSREHGFNQAEDVLVLVLNGRRSD